MSTTTTAPTFVAVNVADMTDTTIFTAVTTTGQVWTMVSDSHGQDIVITPAGEQIDAEHVLRYEGSTVVGLLAFVRFVTDNA